MLVEQPVVRSDRPLTPVAEDFVAAGRARFEQVACFDFVPSSYELAWATLDALPRGRFCEWGSGMGVVTGLAEMLGFAALGIEIDAGLADLSRRLLADWSLSSHIETGDYLTIDTQADVYFVYCWPSRIKATEARFEQIAPAAARLLICYGQSDIRLKVRNEAKS
jgi:hypothetical protein